MTTIKAVSVGLAMGLCATLSASGPSSGASHPMERRGAQSLTFGEHALLGTDPRQEGAFLEVEFPKLPHLRYEISRTAALEYLEWVKEADGVPAARKALLADAAGDGVPNLVKFGLGWDSIATPCLIEDPLPRQVEVAMGGRSYAAIEFVAEKKPERCRVVHLWEADEGNGKWTKIASPEFVTREAIGGGLERVTYRDTQSSEAGRRRLRLTIRYEPVPTIFAHYISELNPGWGAMAHISQPIPAWFRLFHDQPSRMQPVPRGPRDRFASTGGLQRDLPLLPPGFAFSSATESAELEIKRARRAGMDGFAVNCLGGKTEFLDALFEAAVLAHREKEYNSPFLLTLSIDINVIPFSRRGMLPAVADLIREWLAAGNREERQVHLARRGGKPLVMGYQSHWIWIDYLERLVELWELDVGGDDQELVWPASLGPAPETPVLPEVVVADYRQKLAERLRELGQLADPLAGEELRRDFDFYREQGLSRADAWDRAFDSVARRYARTAAARRWARDPDGWRYIREAYQLLERVVGEEIFWQFDAVDMDAITGDPERSLRVVGRDFPAVNLFLPKGDFTSIARRVIDESGAEWGEPIYSQYVAYGQNEQEGLFLGNAHGGDGTETFRKGWYRAIGKNLETGERLAGAERPSSLIQYTTWNDYMEHTHLAPSLQMRYAYAELSRYLVHAWKTGEPPASLGEQIFVFYRKYPERSAAATFPFEHGENFHPARFEVVTILRDEGGVLELLREQSGELVPRAKPRQVEAGFQVETYLGDDDAELWAEGPVVASVVKASGKTLAATGWEEVTLRPFRRDFTQVAASSRCDRLWELELPDRKRRRFSYAEYGDADGDGLPNWFEMLYFGHGWMNGNDQTGADPEGDENRDGKSNREHFLDGTNPTSFVRSVPYREDPVGEPTAIRIDPVGKTRIEAEDFDRGGLGVAYGRSDYSAMQGGMYRKTRYELASHRQVDPHEEDGGDWMVAPLGDGDWMVYTVEIPAGSYRVSARVREGGGAIVMELDDAEILRGDIENRGLWTTQTLGSVAMTPEKSGKQVMRLRFVSPGFGLNWIEFKPNPGSRSDAGDASSRPTR